MFALLATIVISALAAAQHVVTKNALTGSLKVVRIIFEMVSLTQYQGREYQCPRCMKPGFDRVR
jgi:hypothetical protein